LLEPGAGLAELVARPRQLGLEALAELLLARERAVERAALARGLRVEARVLDGDGGERRERRERGQVVVDERALAEAAVEVEGAVDAVRSVRLERDARDRAEARLEDRAALAELLVERRVAHDHGLAGREPLLDHAARDLELGAPDLGAVEVARGRDAQAA